MSESGVLHSTSLTMNLVKIRFKKTSSSSPLLSQEQDGAPLSGRRKHVKDSEAAGLQEGSAMFIVLLLLEEEDRSVFHVFVRRSEDEEYPACSQDLLPCWQE